MSEKPEFLTQIGVPEFWAGVIGLIIFTFLAGMGLMRLINGAQIKTAKERRELAEDRLEQVKEKNADDVKKLEGLQVELAEAKKLVGGQAQPALILQILNSATASTGSLAQSNNAVHRIISAEGMAAGEGTMIAHAEVVKAKAKK